MKTYFAETPERIVYENDFISIDASNISNGYIAIKNKQQEILVKISKSNNIYTYDINQSNNFTVLPLQMGNGSYTISILDIKRNSKIFSKTIDVKIENENLPFLYPNQYVWYNPESYVVSLSCNLCENETNDKKKIKILSNYILKALSYDYIKAKTVEIGYIPDITKILEKRKGICFDYSSVFAAMLRIQNIPVKLIMGYADNIYHAWNEVLVNGKWELYDLTFLDQGKKINKYKKISFY